MNRLRVGVIGFGYWGPNLARNFFDLPAADLVAISDLKQERLQRARSLYPAVTLTDDYTQLFNMGLDAVVVSTPPALHYQIARDCLEHGLNVLVEKPITLNSQHAQELIDLAEARGVILMVGHTFEYNSAVRALKEYIDSGELGEIYYIDTARLNLGLFQRDSNVLWDLAPHDISILLYLLGQIPETVSARGMPCVFEEIFDVAYVNLMFPNGIPAHIHVSWLDPCKVRRVTVVGSKKMIVYNDLENEQKLKIYDKGVDAPEYTNGFGEFQCNYRSGDIVIPNIRFVEPLRQECQHFLDSIITQTQPWSSGREGLKVVKVLEAIESSMRNGSQQERILWEPRNTPALHQM
ncbi:MAG: gfo/Idh/MocA family oxidoreductase [Chloroflexi bacterium]|nr:gfo/Idh/MocA family oxidoreductase [Chloroflexota bacterium]MDL1943030.1 Gfo/Idh/MocA family oxidoreductase [Chloroflexi bacterium CFX2]